MEKKKRFSMALPFTAAFTWFGYHCGSGFASGTQMKVYATKFGKMGLLAPIVAWICCAAFIYIIVEYARLVQAKSYRDVAGSIYWDSKPLGKFIILVWDIMVFFSMIVASGTCVAGFGQLLLELFGLPYFVGCAVFVVFMTLLMCFGTNVLDRLGKISSPLIVLFIIVCVVGIIRGAPNLGAVLTTEAGASSVENATTFDVIKSGFTYGCIQISFVHTACVIGGQLKSRKETNTMIGVGFLLNCGAMLFGTFAILAYYPGNMSSAMPLLDIVRSVPGPAGTALLVVYNFILIMAYITTAGALIAGGIARYRPLLNKVTKKDFISKVIVVLVVLVGASILSVLGLEGVVSKAYGFLANLRKPIWFFPIIILGPISIYRVNKALKASKAAAEP